MQNDILCAIDRGKCVILLLLDLSAAFDTVTHDLLLLRLAKRFGIGGTVLGWFRSYLCDRSQFVRVGSQRSSSAVLDCGVPQGSVLGPILYVMYTSPLADIIGRHNMSFHMYADDTQLYCTFESSSMMILLLQRLNLNPVFVIFIIGCCNNLKFNDDKSEILTFHAKHRPAPSLGSYQIIDSHLNPTQSAKNLGVLLDSTFSYDQHISDIWKSAFHGIRSIARLRKHLDLNTTKGNNRNLQS